MLKIITHYLLLAASLIRRKRQLLAEDPSATLGQLVIDKLIIDAQTPSIEKTYVVKDQVKIRQLGVHIEKLILCPGKKLPTARFTMLSICEDTTFGTITIFGKTLGQFCFDHPRRVCAILRERYKDYGQRLTALNPVVIPPPMAAELELM